ncbi:hypothetical protein SAMN04488493_1106 [Xylanibacter ruminicola]|uniref:hypothetical protein n=1 Tax=Xylanibacter ruminicola TaxID=839 RepID=UPI0008F1D736|nr:hypothetical protein [Xylanibacter ruminicola]SFC56085.1 hypothetical protein SAMN04488493_1106 [Xylanibacter ruminicola]
MNKVKKFSKNKGVFFVLLLLFLFWSIVPAVHNMVDRSFMLLIVILLLPIIISSGVLTTRASVSEKKTLRVMIIFVAWQALLKLVGFSNSAWGTHSEVMLFYFYYLIYLYIKYKFILAEKKDLIRSIILIVLLSIIYYIFMSATGQLRVTYNPDEYEMELEMIPTIFKLELLFVACTCTICLFTTTLKIEKAFHLAIISGSLYIIYVIGNNATATILYLLFLFTAILVNQRKRIYSVKAANLGTLMVVLSLVFFFFILFGDSFLLLIANATEEINPRISNKLMTVYAFAHGSTSLQIIEGNSFVTRLFLMKGSLMTWLDNPFNMIIGVGRNNGFFVESGIGRHSEFIDVFAMYGIIGAIFTISIFSNLFKVIKTSLKPLTASFATFFYFIMVTLGILNNFIYPQIGAILFCFSFVYFDILSEEIKFKQ